jgi:hypothetical protein
MMLSALFDMVSIPVPLKVTLGPMISFVTLPVEPIAIVPEFVIPPETVSESPPMIFSVSPLFTINVFATPLIFKLTVDEDELPLSISTALFDVGTPVDQSAALFQLPVPPTQTSLVEGGRLSGAAKARSRHVIGLVSPKRKMFARLSGNREPVPPTGRTHKSPVNDHTGILTSPTPLSTSKSALKALPCA